MTLLWAVILFGLLIFFHELGHFILAKLVGVKVLKFSLGFGPKLIGKKIGETEYLISAIPLGGYVKPLGEEPGEELTEEDKPRAFTSQTVWKRMAIVLAGPVFNLVLAFLIFFAFLSLNHPVEIPDFDALSPKIVNVSEDSPAMSAGLRVNDIVTAINGKDISTWIEMEGTILENPGKEVLLQVKRDGTVIDIKITPEPDTITDMEGNEIVVGRIGISRRASIIGEVFEDTPARKAGLKKNDTVVSIDGVPVPDWKKMSSILSKSPGREVVMKVMREGRMLDIKVTPEPKIARDSDGNEITVGRIGISSKSAFRVIQSDAFWQAPFKALQAVYEWCVVTLEIVVKLFSGSVSAKQLGGPILIVDAAAKAAAVGAFTYFNFIAIISINLAILNLMPVPVLDGGHIMFLSVEALRGKPLSDNLMMVANRIGMALLLLLITFVFYNDIVRIVVPWVEKTIIAN
jgi:regulator of sigma E protease